jgi:hypothetical protein
MMTTQIILYAKNVTIHVSNAVVENIKIVRSVIQIHKEHYITCIRTNIVANVMLDTLIMELTMIVSYVTIRVILAMEKLHLNV